MVIVQKYGGSSVETIEKMQDIADCVIKKKQEGYSVVLVVSAMGKTTNNLINLTKQITDRPCKREMDALLATGEQISTALLSMIFQEKGYEAISLTGFQAGIRTFGDHMKNKIATIEADRIKECLKAGKIVIVAGFQGINENHDITTLGRGGSDTTAVAVAAMLECPCEIYTDVDGIYGVDPRLYPKAKKLDYIGYEEMVELSSLGTKVMEVRSVEIGQKYNVPIYVASSKTRSQGTLIKEYDDRMEKKSITGLSADDNVLMITINNIFYSPENIAHIFSRFAEAGINVDMISQTLPYNGYVSISFTSCQDDEVLASDVLMALKMQMPGIEVQKNTDITKISVVGIGMRNEPGVAYRMFKVFADHQINFKQVTTSEISISYTINGKDKQKAVNAICEAFEL